MYEDGLWWIISGDPKAPQSPRFLSPCLLCRPAAGSRARKVSSGEEQGAGAGPAADVLHQPGAAAGD